MKKFAIYIPYVSSLETLSTALGSVKSLAKFVTIIDNSDSEDPALYELGINVFRPPVPLGFSQTQNLMREMAFANYLDFYLFMHSDAESQENSAEKLVQLASDSPMDWGVIYTNYDALCALNCSAVRKVGAWDWRGLDWYFADCDYYRRIELAGFQIIRSGLPVAHRPSRTISSDSHLQHVIELKNRIAHIYYIFKWGGAPGQESFTIPFDGKSIEALKKMLPPGLF
ncbi:MAG: hypothetical protein KDD42_07475 [Bdellovibrionales bacterium]|nr:hypothetical protein [Bdellovibrionales bacterium]